MDFAAVLRDFALDHPDIALSLSGPWKPRPDGDVSATWIATFKDQNNGCREMHTGSAGETPEIALAKGIAFVEEWKRWREVGEDVWTETVVRRIVGSLDAAAPTPG